MTNTLIVIVWFQMSQFTSDVVLSQRLIIMSESLQQSMRIHCPSYQPRTTWNLPEIVSVCISVSQKILIFFFLVHLRASRQLLMNIKALLLPFTINSLSCQVWFLMPVNLKLKLSVWILCFKADNNIFLMFDFRMRMIHQ